MGRFFYGREGRLDVDDRVLGHLQVVIANKLRRGEPFHFTWREDISTGGGRTTVWVHPRSHLVFTFAGGRTPRLNRAWLDALMLTANSPAGLHLVPEPEEDASPGAGA
jgi:hypothetical protein